ncbi:MAG: hypothetical protein K2K71_03085 [Eubacterium sp.]|nr:hypothetical protein [Eubacterium sp.]
MKKFLSNAAIKFQRFMYGRYEIDQLYRGLLWIYFAILIISVILGRAVDYRIYTTLSVAGLAIVVFAFFRVFSKNIQKRRSENAKWLVFENMVKKQFRLLRDRWKFRKTHIFRKCPKCKAVLRLKKIKGSHNVTCPHCRENFKIKVL